MPSRLAVAVTARLAVAVLAATALAATACKQRERSDPAKPPPATPMPDAGLADAPAPDPHVMRRVDEARLEGAVELPPEEQLAERIPLPYRLSARGGAHAEAPPLSRRDFDELMESAMTLLADMGKAGEGAGDDCDLAAAAIERAAADHKDLIGFAKRYAGNPEVEQMGKAWMETHQQEALAKAKPLIEVSNRCSGNAKFQATLAKLGDN